MPDVLRFGLIGCGSQGRYLSEALRMTGRAQLTACADVRAEAAETARARCGYQKAYNDYLEMLAVAPLDAVIVATTHDQLFPCAMAAAKAGKHVFVEKPMALNARDGMTLANTARDARVKLMVGYTLRFMPDRILMKRLLDEGAIGSVAHLGGGQLIGGMGGWLGEKAHGGGPLYYIGAHIIDTVLWLAGCGPERVYAEIDWKEGSDVEAGVQMVLRFPGGVTGQVCTSQKLGGRYGWVDVMGSGGRMRAEWESHDLTIQSTVRPEYRHLTTLHLTQLDYMPPVQPDAEARVSGFGYVRFWMSEFAQFIDAIENNTEPPVTGTDGVRVLQVIDAAFESAQTGKPVDVEPY